MMQFLVNHQYDLSYLQLVEEVHGVEDLSVELLVVTPILSEVNKIALLMSSVIV